MYHGDAMSSPPTRHRRSITRAGVIVSLLLFASGCSSSSDDATTSTTMNETATTEAEGSTLTTSTSTAADGGPSGGDCDSITSTFRSVTSVNPDLPDPELATSCDDDVVTVTSSGVPDYPYVETSPGSPIAQDLTFQIPVEPSEAAEPAEVPLLGPVAVAVNGVPIYGPTERTGGDVGSLEGALSDCGSHNGPTGFHIHRFGWKTGVDCLYSADEVATGSALVGWSPDGYPIMSGVVCADDECTSTKQLTSSWSLTDDTLFATDTWSAHSYEAGSGDLDRCNGRTDADGQYRYYTTTTFPYILGCYHGEVADGAGPVAGGPAGAVGQ